MRGWRDVCAAAIGTAVLIAVWRLAQDRGPIPLLLAVLAVVVFMLMPSAWFAAAAAWARSVRVPRPLGWLVAGLVAVQGGAGVWWLLRERGETTAVLAAVAAALVAFNVLTWLAAGGVAGVAIWPGVGPDRFTPRAELARGLCAAVVGVQLFLAAWWLISSRDGDVSVGVLAGLTVGVNLSLWGSAGLLRLLDQRISTHRTTRAATTIAVVSATTTTQSGRLLEASLKVAIVIPAHNEELVIAGSIGSATRVLPLSDIYVVSDASSDATPLIATNAGANVLHLERNRGKAGALEAAIEHFALTDRYDAVLFLDADSELDEDYLVGALEFLADPEICAVAGYATIMWRPDELTVTGQIIAAYRDRLYTLQQRLLKYGQTWARVNVAYIAPGFASVYRSRALRAIEMNPPGLIIEDFNMTFQLHRRRVGRIGFSPSVRAAAQDPDTLGDYVSQVRRWTLGFWQTIRFNGFWPSLFWVSLGLVILESLVASVAFVGAAVIALGLALPALTGGAVLGWAPFADAHAAVAGYVTLPMLALALFGPDFVLTGVMAAIRRRPRYLLLGLAFPVLRLVDAWLALWTLPQAWTARSNGSWRSPTRR